MLTKVYTAVLAVAVILSAMVRATSAAEKPSQEKLIALLQSNAQPGEKAIACKQLAIWGGKEAVPALGALLTDPELTSWARTALEAIPDPSADESLRNAMGKAQGRVLIGIINSIAYRRDAQAVDALNGKLKDADVEVATAAAVALGRIGTRPAAAALEGAMKNAGEQYKPGVAQGLVLCGERMMQAGEMEIAARLFDVVRKAEVPQQRVLEAIRGAILARGDNGIELLTEQLRSPNKAAFAIAVRTVREMKGAAAAEAMLREMRTAQPDRQALMLYALADRGDTQAVPAVMELATNGEKSVRVVAVSVLEKLGDVSCLPVLLEAAANPDPQLSGAAKTTVARMGGKEVDSALFSRLQQSSARMRQVLIELTEQRRLEGALPIFLQSAEDADAGVRTAALVAIGAIGTEKQVGDLTKMIQRSTDSSRRGEIEKALAAICSRYGTAAAKDVLPLAKSDNPADRIVALHALASCGGNDALSAVVSAAKDADGSVQDEAVRTLSTWPNRWPDDSAIAEPLLSIAKSASKQQHQVLALRGYLQYIQGARRAGGPGRMQMLDSAMPLIKRPEEKRLAVSVLSSIGGGSALQKLADFAADESVSDEACSAIMEMVRRPNAGSREQRQAALKAVVANTKNEAMRKRAEEAIRQ